MNKLNGVISSIASAGGISHVHLNVHAITLSSVIIDTPETAPYLKQGQEVSILFKETEVIIGKGKEIPVSLQNRIPCTIRTIERGQILSRISLQYDQYSLISIITTKAVDQMALKENDKVVAMIKTNEVMLAEHTL